MTYFWLFLVFQSDLLIFERKFYVNNFLSHFFNFINMDTLTYTRYIAYKGIYIAAIVSI